jgi:ADP-ribose pyrophosphatase YjhB (NUDIX family)
MSIISAIAVEEQAKRGWSLFVNGEKVKDVSHLRLCNPNFGELEYGKTPGGWDAWTFHEIGGGGVVTLPFANLQGKLHVGLVFQNRPLQGGKVWNAPRGFLDPGEKNFDAAAREIEEEMGWQSPDKRMKMLAGELANPNSAFFDTSAPGEGVKFYAMEILPSQLEPDQDGLWKFRSNIVKPVNKMAELIYGCRFMPWRQATELGDQFTLSAIARLLAAQLIGF